MSTKFRHVSDWGQARFSEELSVNLVQFINQAYLNIGAFQNVVIDQSGAYGGDMARLRPVDDPRYNDGQVWQAFRKNWVWEEVDYAYQPVSISGIYVDGSFQPGTGVGIYEHRVDYPNGLIIFNSGISTNSVVEAEYSYKLVSVYDDRSDWFKEIQYNSQRPDHEHFSQYGSGAWNTLAQSRLQLPIIVCQPLSDVRLEGNSLGAHNDRWQSVLFHIFAENSWDKRTITDDLINQKDAKLQIFDYGKVIESGVYPLNYDGTINPSGLPYSDLIVDYRRRYTFVEDVSAEDFGDTTPQRALVRWWVKIYI